ncbi:MAG: hypothetical protein K9L68_10335 [Spirochaetales bacterium]|nr:hypothetical protein [Spirochaetales bacterium]MCF7938981.1 hypothetical protein [Spirochaetales bacterium]
MKRSTPILPEEKRQRLRRLAAVAVLLLLSPAVALAQISISNGLAHTKETGSGESYGGVIRIKNQGIENERVKLYLSDYLYYADGRNEYREAGSHDRSNAPWIRLGKEEVSIAPGKEQEVAYTVHVPPGGDLTGSFWSLVMVQSITQSILNPDLDEDSVGVNAGVRFGVQIITNIGQSGTRSLDFTNTAIHKGEEYSTLSVYIANTGERKLSAFPYIDVYHSTGNYAGRLESRRRGIFPGTSIRVRFPLEGLETGSYKAQVVADCGGNDLFGAVYSIKIK